MVNVKVPNCVAVVVIIVSVLAMLPFAVRVTGDGLNPQLKDGTGEVQVKVTGLLNPFKEVSTAEEVSVKPAVTEPEEGDTPKLKSTTERLKVA